MDLVSAIMIGVFIFLCLYLFWMWFCFGSCVKTRQKTRTPQQRRPYIGTRGRPSLTPQEPTIYVSPANLPPPPKYEAMAPPSYEEVVGVHYPGFQPPGQPIITPITTAMAQPQTPQTSQSTTNQNQTVNVVNPSTTVPVDSRMAVST